MPIDPSIPLGIRPPEQINPLTQLGQYAGIANALAQNKLYDIAAQRQQVGLETDKQQQAATSVNRIAQQTARLLIHPDLSSEMVTQAINDGVQSGDILPQQANVALKNVQAIGNDTNKLRAFLTANLVGQLAGPQQVAEIFGSHGEQDNGAQILSGVRAPARVGGAFVAGGATGKTLSPEAATAPTQVGVTPQGAPVMGTRQQFIQGATGQSMIPGNGRLPAALRGPNAQPQTGGGVVTGLGPAQQAQLAAQGGASAGAFASIAQMGQDATSQNAVLDNMLADTSRFVTGAGSDSVQRVQAAIQSFAPGFASKVMGIDPDKLSAKEGFDKFAAQLANAQGAGSDARLSVTQTANPSSHLTPQGVDEIIRKLQGNNDYLRARARLAATYPDQSNRAAFESEVGQKLDPRFYQYNRLQPDQKATFLNSMKGDKDAFKRGYLSARDAGWLNAQ